MRHFGLIGFPLGHSFSKKYFTRKFDELGLKDHNYELYELKSIDMFPDLWNDPDLVGLNVTVPYKEAVKKYLHDLGQSAEKVGAVNVIMRKDNKLIGHNSDYYGFRTSLENFLPDNSVKKALILGTGGSSKAVKAVLNDLNIQEQFISRSAGEETMSYEQVTPELVKETQLIVNTTPLGMHPKTDNCPEIPYEALGPSHYLFDLVYNPEVTRFMERGLEKGAQAKSGLEMLHLQADKSWEIWNT